MILKAVPVEQYRSEKLPWSRPDRHLTNSVNNNAITKATARGSKNSKKLFSQKLQKWHNLPFPTWLRQDSSEASRVPETAGSCPREPACVLWDVAAVARLILSAACQRLPTAACCAARSFCLFYDSVQKITSDVIHKNCITHMNRYNAPTNETDS